MERLHRKLEVLRRLNLDRVCSLVTEEDTTSTISAMEQALSQAVTQDTKCSSPVQLPEPVKASDSAVQSLQGIRGGAQVVQLQHCSVWLLCYPQ